LSNRFIGVDIGGQLKQYPDHVYCVATRNSDKGQRKRVVCLTRERIEELRKKVPDWEEKLAAILYFISVNHKDILQENYAIFIDKDFQGATLTKVERYLKRLFGKVNYGKGYRADPPFTFIPRIEDRTDSVKHADIKAQRARGKDLLPDEKDPSIDELLEILEDARRKKIV